MCLLTAEDFEIKMIENNNAAVGLNRITSVVNNMNNIEKSIFFPFNFNTIV